MAFSKRKRFPRRRTTKRRTRRMRPSTTSLQVQMNKLRRDVAPEIKIHRVSTGLVPLPGGGVFPLHQVHVGANDQQRIGSSIKFLRCSARIHIQMNDASTKPTNQFRLILFRGKNEGLFSFNVNDVLANPGGLMQITSPKNWATRFRTKFIYDKTYTLSRQGKSTIVLNWNFKLFGHTQFSQNDTVGSDIENGGVYILFIGDSPNADAPVIEAQFQLSFIDS